MYAMNIILNVKIKHYMLAYLPIFIFIFMISVWNLKQNSSIVTSSTTEQLAWFYEILWIYRISR